MCGGVCVFVSPGTQSPKEGVRCPGDGIIDGCGPLDVDARIQTPILSKSNLCSYLWSPPTKILIYAAADVFVCVHAHIHEYTRMEVRGQLWEFSPTFTWMCAKDGAYEQSHRPLTCKFCCSASQHGLTGALPLSHCDFRQDSLLCGTGAIGFSFLQDFAIKMGFNNPY